MMGARWATRNSLLLSRVIYYSWQENVRLLMAVKNVMVVNTLLVDKGGTTKREEMGMKGGGGGEGGEKERRRIKREW